MIERVVIYIINRDIIFVTIIFDEVGPWTGINENNAGIQISLTGTVHLSSAEVDSRSCLAIFSSNFAKVCLPARVGTQARIADRVLKLVLRQRLKLLVKKAKREES